MEASLIGEAVTLATTQGRPSPLVVKTAFEGKTVNMSPRGNRRQVFGVCYHETATPDTADMPFLMRQHQGSTFPTSWHGGIDFNGDFYIFVPHRTHLAWAQGISAVESLGWHSAECQELLFSLEVCGRNIRGVQVRREQIQAVVAFMWWADANLGIPITDWERRYFTHAGIGRFELPPFPNQKHGRKHDPEGYNPIRLVQEALDGGSSVDTAPPTGIYKVVLTNGRANVRSAPRIADNIIDHKFNGNMVTIAGWEVGEVPPTSSSHWWARLNTGGYIHQSVLTLALGVPATPALGTWFVSVSTRNANVHSIPSSSQNTIVGQIANRKPVQVLEWRHGDMVQGTNWWARTSAGWLSIVVLTQTAPSVAAPLSTRAFAQATLLQGRFLPMTRRSDIHVACNDHDHDA